MRLIMLLALAWGLTASLLDPHAAERDPWHRHIFLGGTAREKAHALAFHQHRYEPPHAHDPAKERALPARPVRAWTYDNTLDSSSFDATAASGEQDLVIIRASSGVGVPGFGIGGKALLMPEWAVPSVPWAYLRQLRPLAGSLTRIALSAPDPPPRWML
jgi:hypothetical protein